MDNTLSVVGIAKKEVIPDWIVINTKILEQNINYEKAVEKANEKFIILQSILNTIGFKKEDLKIVNFSVESIYDVIDEKRIFTGFLVSYDLKLGFTFESQKLNDVIKTISNSLSQPELNISFVLKDPDKYREELINKAISNAKEIAEILVKAGNMRLAKLLNIQYNQQINPINPYTIRHLAKDNVFFNPQELVIQEMVTLKWLTM